MKSAISFAVNRQLDPKNLNKQIDETNLKVMPRKLKTHQASVDLL